MDSAIDKYRKQHFLGAGWAFPIAFSKENHQLDTTAYEKNINDSIKLILQTNRGARPMEPSFGSKLNTFFFRKLTQTLKGEIMDTVRFALLNNEPRITVNNVMVDYPNQGNGQVLITIDYNFNQTNTRHNYVYPFHIKEGTNLSKNS